MVYIYLFGSKKHVGWFISIYVSCLHGIPIFTFYAYLPIGFNFKLLWYISFVYLFNNLKQSRKKFLVGESEAFSTNGLIRST